MVKSAKDNLIPIESLIGDNATLLSPKEVYSQLKELSKRLEQYLVLARPNLPAWHEHRQVKAYRQFLMSQPYKNWSLLDLEFLAELVLKHTSDDMRFHAAESLGRYICGLDLEGQKLMLTRLTDNLIQEQINPQIFETCFNAQIAQGDYLFLALPSVIQRAILIRQKKLTTLSLKKFLLQEPQWQVDVLEYAGK